MKMIWVVAPLLLACCGRGADAGGAGGHGGAASAPAAQGATAGSSSRASSGAGSPQDAGYGPGTDGAPCATCKDAIEGERQIEAVGDFCPGIDGGYGPVAYYYQYVACGCAPQGACAPKCGNDQWCKGIYPKAVKWTDPSGDCAVCLDQKGSTGCGTEKFQCLLR